jgi:N-acetylglucosamine-6-phosphate deacetylase
MTPPKVKLTAGNSFVINHGRLILPDRVVEDGWVRVSDGVISEIGNAGEPVGAATCPVLDAGGQFVAPGFVDVHCHGDAVTRFFDDPEAVAINLLRQGATTVLATLGYPDMVPDLAGQVRRFKASLGPWSRELVAGVHLEGPYVNRKYGAQTSRGMIKHPDAAEYRALMREYGGFLKWWTCAPELPGILPFIREAVAGGGVVGAGHTEASPDEVVAAISAGLSVITHWSNATGNPRAAAYAGTRCPGIDEAALVFDELATEIIPDEKGLHVHPLMARLLFKAKGPERILIITDAGYKRPDDPPAPPGPARDVSIDADGNLAGSRLSMAGAARNFRRFTGCSWPELFRMAALNAARRLKLDHQIGSIAVGKQANLIVFTDDLTVSQSFLKGRTL